MKLQNFRIFDAKFLVSSTYELSIRMNSLVFHSRAVAGLLKIGIFEAVNRLSSLSD